MDFGRSTKQFNSLAMNSDRSATRFDRSATKLYRSTTDFDRSATKLYRSSNDRRALSKDFDRSAMNSLAQSKRRIYPADGIYIQTSRIFPATSSREIVSCPPERIFLSVTLFSASSLSPRTQTNETFICEAYLNCFPSLSASG